MIAFGLCAATMAFAFLGNLGLVWAAVIIFGTMVASSHRARVP